MEKKSFKTPLMFTARILANSVEDDSISKKLVYLSMCYLLYPLKSRANVGQNFVKINEAISD